MSCLRLNMNNYQLKKRSFSSKKLSIVANRFMKMQKQKKKEKEKSENKK